MSDEFTREQLVKSAEAIRADNDTVGRHSNRLAAFALKQMDRAGMWKARFERIENTVEAAHAIEIMKEIETVEAQRDTATAQLDAALRERDRFHSDYDRVVKGEK